MPQREASCSENDAKLLHILMKIVVKINKDYLRIYILWPIYKSLTFPVDYRTYTLSDRTFVLFGAWCRVYHVAHRSWLTPRQGSWRFFWGQWLRLFYSAGQIRSAIQQGQHPHRLVRCGWEICLFSLCLNFNVFSSISYAKVAYDAQNYDKKLKKAIFICIYAIFFVTLRTFCVQRHKSGY